MDIYAENGTVFCRTFNGDIVAAGPYGIDDTRVINIALSLGGDIRLHGGFTITEMLVPTEDAHLIGGSLLLDLKDYWFNSNGVQQVTLENMIVDGNREAIGALFDASEKTDGWFAGVDMLRVINCEFRHFSGTPIAVMYGGKANIRGNVFKDILGHTSYGGVSAACSAGCYFRDTDSVIIQGNHFDTIDDNAVGISGSGVTIIGNTMRECRFLAYVADSPTREMLYAIIQDNRASQMYRGIVLGYLPGSKWARNVTIIGNDIKTDSTVQRWASVHESYLFDAIITQHSAENIIIANNTIDAAARALSQEVNAPIQRIRIQGNRVTHKISNNLNLDVADCVLAGNTFITNGVNASQYPLQTLNCDVHGNKFIINVGQPPFFEGGTVFDNFGDV